MTGIEEQHTADPTGGFDCSGDIGEVRALENGVACMSCDSIRRFEGYMEASSRRGQWGPAGVPTCGPNRARDSCRGSEGPEGGVAAGGEGS